MNILSIPSLVGGHSHLIPLFVMHQRYFKRLPYVNNFFLVGEQSRALLSSSGINCVDAKYEISQDMSVSAMSETVFSAEKKSFDLVKPDIILEDNCFTSPLISEKNGVPRISIHRTGFFRSIDKTQRRHHHFHSAEKGDDGRKGNDLLAFLHEGLQPSDTMPDLKLLKKYLHAKTKVVPGIPSIELLPDNISNKESYFFSGPLIVKDNASEALISELKIFFDSNKNRRKVFLTLGLIDNSAVGVYIAYLLAQGYCVITTVHYEILNEAEQQRLFQNRFLPLDLVSSSVDLIIHQCGSGIYHYPILHEKPAITLGTLCYDREDVALVLQMRGVSKHVPHPKDDDSHLNIFKEFVRQFEDGNLCNFEQLSDLKSEVCQTMLAFDIEEVIQHTLN
ncbi:glycosyltransferase family 1 protein [Dyadobacter arcticus]|uniref:UDP:flavonoid glycosyltransferase YjiC, YdhE family n=1 Tax=Dyadobacter arcticus TaxID=1078754 RepID=A0ABX0UIZ7_9BACT|nr:glycosyltransferase family 1 protein [Dyadobacter arcticus]NIJ52982.1 hypothetical protein [Dyadobacter arcticus]